MPDWLRDIIKIFTGNGINLAASLGSTVLLTRYLGVSDYGEYTFILSLQAFGMVFVNSLSSGSLVYLNQFKHNWETKIKTLFRIRTLSGGVMAALIAAAAWPLSKWIHNNPEFILLYVMAGAQILFFSWEQFLLQVFFH